MTGSRSCQRRFKIPRRRHAGRTDVDGHLHRFCYQSDADRRADDSASDAFRSGSRTTPDHARGGNRVWRRFDQT